MAARRDATRIANLGAPLERVIELLEGIVDHPVTSLEEAQVGVVGEPVADRLVIRTLLR